MVIRKGLEKKQNISIHMASFKERTQLMFVCGWVGVFVCLLDARSLARSLACMFVRGVCLFVCLLACVLHTLKIGGPA